MLYRLDGQNGDRNTFIATYRYAQLGHKREDRARSDNAGKAGEGEGQRSAPRRGTGGPGCIRNKAGTRRQVRNKAGSGNKTCRRDKTRTGTTDVA